MAYVSEIVRFLDSYSRMNATEKTDPRTLRQVELVKGWIKDNLPVNLFMSLGHAIALAEASGDEVWLKGLVAEAEPLARALTEEDDIQDIQPIFERYLGRQI